MTTASDRHSAETRLVLRIFQAIALLGLAYCVALFAGSGMGDNSRYIVYTVWFALAIVSVEAILRRVKAGLYALVVMTIIVMLVDIVTGAASWGGATLGILLAFVIGSYLFPFWRRGAHH